jgi:SAM-dependent methyltransferase
VLKEDLARSYERHHRAVRGAGFAFEGALRAAFFASHIGGGKRVMDLGCRDGTMAAQHRRENVVTGVDIDRAALGRAEALGIDTVWADIGEPLPFENSRFDAAVAGELLEHLPNPETVLDEVVRVLTPDGLFVGSVPNAFRLKNRLRFLIGRPPETDMTHLQHFSPERLGRALERRFARWEITFAASRLLRLSPRLFANSMLFVARRPLSRA